MEVKIAYQAWKLTFIVNISRIEQDIKELSKILNNEVETIEIDAHFVKYTNLRIILMILLARGGALGVKKCYHVQGKRIVYKDQEKNLLSILEAKF